MKKLVLVAVLTAGVCAFADKVITTQAPDGQNIITQRVNDDGFITSQSSTCVHVCEKYEPTNDEDAEVREQMQEALRQMEAQEKEAAVGEAIVKEVYGEDAKSSFIVRKELTATQKRFLALGKRYIQLLYYVQSLESRLTALEDIENERLEQKALRFEVSRAKSEDSAHRRQEKVRRAVERGQNAGKKKGLVK